MMNGQPDNLRVKRNKEDKGYKSQKSSKFINITKKCKLGSSLWLCQKTLSRMVDNRSQVYIKTNVK